MNSNSNPFSKNLGLKIVFFGILLGAVYIIGECAAN